MSNEKNNMQENSFEGRIERLRSPEQVGWLEVERVMSALAQP